MKKIRICFLIICLIICCSSVTLATNFYDIKGTQYEGVVDRVAGLGIINGMSETTFAPNKGITRAELAKMIVYTRGLQEYADEMKFEPIFSDVKSHWAENYIYVATDLQVLNGYKDGTFKPDKEVSYAEVIAIVLRCLGYVNIDETAGESWYTGYTKRMYDINLHKGVSNFPSFTAPAKRGDVAVLWWNMLISDRWAVESQSTVSGLHYTYSPKTQLEILFPDYKHIKGNVNNIVGTYSGDIVVEISSNHYQTNSEVPIYALGASATGVYDTKGQVLYGFSIDDEIADYKIVSGPLFYLEDEGYNINKAKKRVSYGPAGSATYAYLLVSKDESVIYRAVLLNGSESVVVDEVKIEYDEDDDKKDIDTVGKVLINGEEYTTTDAAIIKNGKRLEWTELENGDVLTELIENALYTYETRRIEGSITKYDNLEDELYINNDKYLISSNCIYTVYSNNEEKDKEKETIYDYKNMDEEELEELLPRKKIFYLNAAEEISMIEFGNYLDEHVSEKYEDSKYQFMYITSVGYILSEEKLSITGINLNGEKTNYKIKSEDTYSVGDLVMFSEISGRDAGKISVIDKSGTYDDISVLYDTDAEYYNNSFGEYTLTKNTVILRVLNDYEDNSNEEVDECSITRIENVADLGDLSKYIINIFYNEEMDIEVLVAERELNKTTYPVARISEIKEIKNTSEEDDDDNIKKKFEFVSAKFVTINGGPSKFYTILSGDAQVGELVTYELAKEDEVKIKERFRTLFIGYEKDLCIESYDRRDKVAKVVGSNEFLDLALSTYNYNGKVYDLLDYKYLVSNVSKDITTGEWKFVGGNFYEKEDIVLEAGDRIAFNELNGIAVIYRGYAN